MKNNPVNWFEIYVQDMARAKRFYESVFQVTLEKINSPDTEMWGFPSNMERYGSCGSLVKMEGVCSGGTAQWSISLAPTAPSRLPASKKRAGRYTRRKRPSGSMASWCWRWTPRAT